MDRRRFLGMTAAGLSVGALPALADAADGAADPDKLADLLVDGDDPLIRAAKSAYLRDGVARHYALRNYAAFWFGADTPDGRAARLAEGLASADRDALDPRDYDPTRLPNWDKSPEHRELAYSFAAARYGIDVQSGRADPKVAEPDLFVYPRDTQPDSVLLKLGLADDPQAALAAMAPTSARYRALRQAYAEWRGRAEGPSLPPVPDGPSLKPDMSDPRVPVLRDRLAALGYGPGVGGTVYDAATVEAVTRFQADSGLTADGVAGKKTLAELNADPADRTTTIALNMERLRWMPDELGARHVAVNIADFSLVYSEEGQPVLEMPVVVGRPYRKTPVFSDKIRYLEFSPTWTVPPTILRKDMIPKLKKDPSLIEKFGYEFFTGGDQPQRVDPATIDWPSVTPSTFRYQIRQRPGDDNALGRVKFMFPNTHNVYLHDSPAKELYARSERAFSSGCIRVARPEALAAALLKDLSDWTEERIASSMAQPSPVRVSLPTPVPVHLTYLTAWVDAAGVTRFRPDIYERDAVLREALAPSG